MSVPVPTISNVPNLSGNKSVCREERPVDRLPNYLPSAWKMPLPELPSPMARLACRGLIGGWGGRIHSIVGLANAGLDRDPFIVALNHSQRTEALLIPAVLAALRRGRLVHFMADWNFLLLPIVGTVIRLSKPITVVRKDLKPRWLNFLKPRFASGSQPFEEAAAILRSGRSIGVFPEGTVNRHRTQLLRGLSGAARLSVETGIPILPVGIRFTAGGNETWISDREHFSIHFGQPLSPGFPEASPSNARVGAWHAEVMQAIACLSGKNWSPNNPRIKYASNSPS